MVLIGFMGTGKSTVGAALATNLGWQFADLDRLLESRLGTSIAEFFSRHGEAVFRAEERRLIAELNPCSGVLWSAGGGAVLQEANVAALRRLGPLVLLTASTQTICQRLLGDQHRPLLKAGTSFENIDSLLQERLPQYLAAADLIIPTDGLSVAQVVEAIKNHLAEFDHELAGRG